jgi:hypothetical protein
MLGAKLFVAAGCLAVVLCAVEAKPRAHWKRDQSDDNDNDDDGGSFFACMETVQQDCTSYLEELKDSSNYAMSETGSFSFRPICNNLIGFDECITWTMNTKCSENDRDFILAVLGKQRTALTNAIQFVCTEHLDDINHMADCAIGKILTGDDTMLMGLQMCDVQQQGYAGMSAESDLCRSEVSSVFKCTSDVFGKACGENYGLVIRQFGSQLLRDLGCTNLQQLKRRALNNRAVRRISRELFK